MHATRQNTKQRHNNCSYAIQLNPVAVSFRAHKSKTWNIFSGRNWLQMEISTFNQSSPTGNGGRRIPIAGRRAPIAEKLQRGEFQLIAGSALDLRKLQLKLAEGVFQLSHSITLENIFCSTLGLNFKFSMLKNTKVLAQTPLARSCAHKHARMHTCTHAHLCSIQKLADQQWGFRADDHLAQELLELLGSQAGSM